MEMGKKIQLKSNERLLTLMMETAINRRKWIMDSSPSVKDIQTEFPALLDFSIVSFDLSYLCNIFNLYFYQLIADFCDIVSFDKDIIM